VKIVTLKDRQNSPPKFSFKFSLLFKHEQSWFCFLALTNLITISLEQRINKHAVGKKV